jgi:uncharacterized protein YqgC (DUF456 family)
MIDSLVPGSEAFVPLATYFGRDVVVWVAVLLTLLAVVGSLVPLLPGGLLSLAGVSLYWWHTGYSDPGLVVLVVLTLLALLVVVVDWLGGAISAKVSGAANSTTVLAGVAGFLLFFVAGPLGILAGIAGVVFLAEYRRTGASRQSSRTAVYTTIGMLASNVAQALLTAVIFLAFLLVVFL